jgi:hypothetical protein
MKSIYIFFISLILIAGCTTDEIDKYNNANYIYFEHLSKNVLEYSFSFHPGKDQDTIPVVVKLIGDISDNNRSIALSVDPSNTTAQSSDYSLPENIVLTAGKVIDTISLILYKTERLKENKFSIRLEIKDNEELKCGPLANSYIDILFSDMLSKPVWWDSSIESNFLGTYSDTKYRLFIEATGISDMAGLSESEKRAYALIFRDFLERGREQGIEYIDEFGLITVPVKLFG